MGKITKIFIVVLITLTLLLSACGKVENSKNENTSDQNASYLIAPHEGLNQEPIPVKVERDGKNVFIEMTAQITDIQIDNATTYKAWTFNGEAPGPLIKVKEGDTIHFKLKNLDPAIPHSMDFHAVHTAPNIGFADVLPNEDGTFVYEANYPGVFMYHCGTDPILSHIANGMHGMIIVEPENGYPTDDEIDVEYVIIQNEWYKYNDLNDMTNGVPSQVVFSTKALHEGQANTDGKSFGLTEKTLHANVGDKVRFYLLNVGPNELSSFHIVGTIMDDVYLDGNPENHLKGMQTVLLGASNGAVVEFTVKEAGQYPFVTHQFNHATKGAVGVLVVE